MFRSCGGLDYESGGFARRTFDRDGFVELPENILRGGSCIVAPDGGFVVEPIFDEEKIITAELDLTRIDKEKMTLDVSGHYSRPDVFDFVVNRKSRRN